MQNPKRYVGRSCGHLYNESVGNPEGGFPPGTKWEDLPDTWTCPDCGAPRSEFEVML
jgi:rubredoxin